MNRWSAEQLAYFAGILDGEGCFCLHRQGHSHRFSCQIQVGNTDPRLMEWIRSTFNGSVNLENRRNLRHKPVFRWIANANDMDAILSAVVPYLVVKKEQAELLVAYRATLPPIVKEKRSSHDIPEPMKQARTAIHAKLVVLNRRGIA